MNTFGNISRSQSGFSMIEVLVTLIILLVGLLGLAGLMVQSQRSEMESYQRIQALILLQDLSGRINANRRVASCYAFTTTTATGTPYLGTTGVGVLSPMPTCSAGTAAQNTQAGVDLAAWKTLLQGAAETSAGTNVGAMIGARGCVSYDSTQTLLDSTGATISGSGIYTVAIAWQGLGSTAVATPNCAQGLYGTSEAQRRVASLTFRTAALSSP